MDYKSSLEDVFVLGKISGLRYYLITELSAGSLVFRL